MFCKICGAEIINNEKNCRVCGAIIDEDQPSTVNLDHVAPIREMYADSSTFSTASGGSYNYVVLQVTLKEKFFGTGSGNLTQLESAINAQAALGYRLHTISTATSHSTGFGGGDRIQATMVFEKINK